MLESGNGPVAVSICGRLVPEPPTVEVEVGARVEVSSSDSESGPESSESSAGSRGGFEE